jgi:hypothetical protein
MRRFVSASSAGRGVEAALPTGLGRISGMNGTSVVSDFSDLF